VGNYDFWRQSSELAQQLKSNANAKKEEQIKQLQEFVARFSANASKSKQATARKKQLDKITLDDIKPSSRKYPYVKFTQQREIGNDLLQVRGLALTVDGQPAISNASFILHPGEKTAIISRSDVTATQLLQMLAGAVQPDAGEVAWGVTTVRGYMPKDLNSVFEDDTLSILDWLRQYAPKDQQDNTFLRGFLGRMLFSGDDVLKPINVLSGGEKVRSILSKLMLTEPNVLIMDDPTNHLDLESIQSLNDALVAFPGSVIFTSHDHEFIETIADHIIEVGPLGVVDRADTTYDEFLEHPVVKEQAQNIYG
jgi:ATPase subunit of ABC transporter with duplicated ATPase domains